MTNQSHAATSNIAGARIDLCGQVQGIGVRPAIARYAAQLRLAGQVRNTPQGVLVEVEGDEGHIDTFLTGLPLHLPTAASVTATRVCSAPVRKMRGFDICRTESSTGAPATLVPGDIRICEACCEETRSPSDKRFGYPFVSCTRCGPRYSLIRSMPWDRTATAMHDFPLCPDCRVEFDSATDRRFHAQTNACHDCGPQVRFKTDAGTFRGNSAITCAAGVIKRGGIVAVKGLGGYQFVCSACDATAVGRIRQLKQRPVKPLAVMVRTAGAARQLGIVGDSEFQSLTDPTNPIVLLNTAAHRSDRPLADGIHPHLNRIGVFLPTTPLHLQLLDAVDGPCVVTSGNLSGSPIEFRDPVRWTSRPSEENHHGSPKAVPIPILTHNREIIRPVDDSVVRDIGGEQVTLRCARGLAPLPLSLKSTQRILAVGANQKVAVALSNGLQSVLGPHIGDLETVPYRERFTEHVEQICGLYRMEPDYIAHDLHPDFFTTRWAAQQNCSAIAVQHHHAHVVAGMVENDWVHRDVLGVALDGTGYGPDGTIWGGEFLLSTAAEFERVARFRPFPLPGGEYAIHEPWRVALALLRDSVGCESALARLGWLPPGAGHKAEQLARLLDRTGRTETFPMTSSAGRLFDGIASLLLHIDSNTYEGESAVRLESICDPTSQDTYPMDIHNGVLQEVDWRPMIRAILSDQAQGVPAAVIAARATESIAVSIATVCRDYPHLPVVLTGGCFQNARLTEHTHLLLKQQQCEVGLHRQIPPNDGGLAAGQLAVAASRIQKGLV